MSSPRNYNNCILIVLLCFVITACQSPSKTKTKPHPKQPSDYKMAKLQQITKQGVNRYPSISKDHRQMLFVSSKRQKHEHSQIYLLDYNTKQERRITFQSGHVANPQFTSKNQFIYESTTDEDKELSNIISNKLKRLPSKTDNTPFSYKNSSLSKIMPFNNYELYISDFSGQFIKRLTYSPLFDGGADWVSPKEILYSSIENNQIDLKRLTKKRKKWKSSQITKTTGHELQPQVHSSTNKMAWVNMSINYLNSTLLVGDIKGESVEIINQGPHHSLFPSWHPSGSFLVFSSNMTDPQNYELFAYDYQQKCIKRLTYLSSQELDPTFSPDGKYLYFSSDIKENFQIYRIKFNPPVSCHVNKMTAKI